MGIRMQSIPTLLQTIKSRLSAWRSKENQAMNVIGQSAIAPTANAAAVTDEAAKTEVAAPQAEEQPAQDNVDLLTHIEQILLIADRKPIAFGPISSLARKLVPTGGVEAMFPKLQQLLQYSGTQVTDIWDEVVAVAKAIPHADG
jgi:hypothetical protein